jgi:NAD(P)-dependent dehydrogenase (short-subunit alcohol dehydrogenase family)
MMPRMPSRFDDPVVIVTGAGRGIGAATAALFVEEGARVALVARTAAEVEARARELGTRALAVVADVSDEHEVERAFGAIRATLGEPRHLVNNAGTLGKSPLIDMPVATWDRVMAVNLRGAFLCSRAFLRGRPKELGGTIVNITSISGAVGLPKFPGFAAYATSKAGLLAFTEVLATEAQAWNVRVNAVSPGSTDTAMFSEAAPGMTPHLTPTDIARVILFACSDDSAPLRGKSIDAWG